MKLVAIAISTLFASLALASNGLVIHTTEFGVGKFHRYDNKVHAYGANHAWAPYILPDGAPTDKPLTRKNADGSYTVFFSTLDEMMTSVVSIANKESKKVSVLNVHGHGLPGAMWFPKDAATLQSWSCADWVEAASGSDTANYNQYYSPISAGEVEQIRDISNNPGVKMSCTTGANEWRDGVAKNPAFRAVFADDAQMHFISCVVGLGTVGEAFTKEIASLVLPKGSGHVETSMNFGLGDWSMPQGMGFWDYISEQQIERDNQKYPTDRQDSEIAQKGTMRVASFNGTWSTSLIGDRDFMSLGFETVIQGTPMVAVQSLPSTHVPSRVRVPGTSAYVNVEVR